jgi:hypothetical protein
LNKTKPDFIPDNGCPLGSKTLPGDIPPR